jgi:hypothetical protein
MIELPEAQERIEPIRPNIVHAHLVALKRWEELLTEQPHLALPLDTTARADFIHDHVCHEIALQVEDVPDVEPTEALSFFALKIGCDVLLRFKYLRRGKPSNPKTTQQRLLEGQHYTEEMVLALTGDAALIPPTLLTAGYTLDGTEVKRIEIRRDCKGHLPWRFDIYGGTTVVEPIVFPGMAHTAKPAVVVSSRRKKAEANGEIAERG